MGSLCPKDLKPCMDDICRGAGCLETGEDLLERCPQCKQVYDYEGCDCESWVEYSDED